MHHSDGEIEAFYEQVHTAKNQTKSTGVVIVMGDMNAEI